ncbi:glycoside hydrolase family 3 N-terminal domain-containing protein [Nocardiopsis sp. NRRL B-16309]|uniref:beta-xylosidase/alpha-l-arabinosidase n=1 Tax=Nocardiopsis sp. NRRL B-16309 TaxID=1519494 RepID=UPI0006B04F70|nr:glycoside hydrolase family 3 N-terminal domain-containing protein [Nocardiopsis sp. NRRL B-16309]KOX15633.1 beta-glucosidase [Nocardiopsis sp. NRRL B-16309]
MTRASDSTDLDAWRDPALATDDRVDHLLGLMTLEEKAAQLRGLWVGADESGTGVAPHQHDMVEEPPVWEEAIADGLGQLTRPFGTAPVDPAAGARSLARSQREVAAANRFGIPAQVHEECLAGFTTWKATVYPVPPAWGAAFDPDLVERMAAQIGAGMRRVGVHQGLAPVLDVARDLRWGRIEETIGEDPYLVGTIAGAYVRGLESSGIVATLKHFVGYSASRAGRNLAPAPVGPREVADVLLPPFEMALRHGGARSVMHSYTDNDGVPAAADRELLTGLLRDTWGFEGTVVADYFGVSFLRTLHRVAESEGRAAALALSAGVDVELPTLRCYGAPLVAAVRAGEVPESLVDRAARRVLRQKCELGLLDPDWDPESDGAGAARGGVDLDPAPQRDLARRLAEESVVLLANDGVLPLSAGGTIAVVGPNADTAEAMLGCYSFPSHVGVAHPDLPLGVEIPTVVESLRAELPDTGIVYARGCGVDDGDTSGITEAVALARGARVCVVVLGDRAGLFGRGTSGEGCDATDLRLPGAQHDLVAAVAATGTPVVLVQLGGRPYALDGLSDRVAAVVQAFFPGEEGGPAVAGVLSGRVNPSGRMPFGLPRGPGGQPSTYLGPPLAGRSEVSSVDPTPLYAFGHGMSYTDFSWSRPRLDGTVQEPGDPALEVATDGEVTVACTVRNDGPVAGTEVVQLYLGDPVAAVTRPVRRLIGYARVDLEPGDERRVEFGVHADLAAYTGPDLRRIVDPGDLELSLAASSADPGFTFRIRLGGPVREVGHTRRLLTESRILRHHIHPS